MAYDFTSNQSRTPAKGIIRQSFVDFGNAFLGMLVEGGRRQLVAFFAEKGVGMLSRGASNNTDEEKGEGKDNLPSEIIRRKLNPPYEIRATLFFASDKLRSKHGNDAHNLITFSSELLSLHGIKLLPHPENKSPFELNYSDNLFYNEDSKNDSLERKTFYSEIYKIREAANQKFRDDIPVKQSARIPIIFCYFVNNKESSVINGITIRNEDSPVVAPKWLPFILINLNTSNFNRATIAHELIHAAGHRHPKGGGNNDGVEYDVMNFNSQRLSPNHILIRNEHVEMLSKAYFSSPLAVGAGKALKSVNEIKDETDFIKKFIQSSINKDIKDSISLFVDVLRNVSTETDVTLSYGQFSVKETTNYQAKNTEELFLLAYGSALISERELKLKVNAETVSNTQPFLDREMKDCFNVASYVATKYHKSLKKAKKKFSPKKFGGAIAGVKETKDKNGNSLLIYSEPLVEVYDEIITGLDSGYLIKVGVLSGEVFNPPNKKINPETGMPNPDHFLLIFDYFKIDNIYCFLFWDSDHITTNFSSLGFKFNINKKDESSGLVFDGFGILFGLEKSFSTGFNSEDLISIGAHPSKKEVYGNGYHQKLQSSDISIIRHRYQVYYVLNI